MDPLSITAGVIAVLQAANTIISLCYEFRAIISNSPSALSRVLEEVKDLRNVLENLEKLASKAEKEDGATEIARLPSLKLLCEAEKGPLDMCLKSLNALIQKLAPPGWAGQGASKRKALVQAFNWKLKEADTTKFLLDLERFKSTLSLALTADEATLLLAIHDMTTSSTSKLSDLNENVTVMFRNLQSQSLEERRKKLLQWLSPVDFRSNHEAAMKAHQRGTSNWFILSEDFRHWYEADQSLLWLSGFPGSGKTTLFSATVEHLRKTFLNRDGYLALFYCDFRKAESRDPLNVIGSIVAQLCSKLEWFPAELENEFDNSTAVPGHQGKVSFSTLQQALTSITREHQLFILIDALDECDNKESILTLINELRSQELRLNIFLTSRDGRDIKDGLQDATRLRIESQLPKMAEDINFYVTSRINDDGRLRKLNPAMRQYIEDVLTSRAEGMFRWVQCQIDQILALRTPKAIREALNTLPRSLNETYDNILIKVPEQEVEVVRRILQWLAFNVMSLSLHEVHEAVAIEPDTSLIDDESRLISPQDIIDLCGSLVTVSDHGIVTLAHLSVKEYLLSYSIRESRVFKFALVADRANADLAISCLTYLSFQEFSSGPAASSMLFEERVQRYPLLEHAAIAWPYYVRKAGQPDELNQQVYQFFSPASRNLFMSWIQVLNANARDRNSRWKKYNPDSTPLYYAASFGLDKIVCALINDGVDIDASGGRFGATAFHAAVLRSHRATMNTLLEAGADINKEDFIKRAPLDEAATSGDLEILKLLLEHGADLGHQDDRGFTAYQKAIRVGQLEAADLLLEWAREHGSEEKLALDPDEDYSYRIRSKQAGEEKQC